MRSGYGYQLWLSRPGRWLLFGMGGQIVYGDPTRGLAVVVTADTQACAGADRLVDDVLDQLVDPLVKERDGGRLRSTGDSAGGWDLELRYDGPVRTVVAGRNCGRSVTGVR